MTTSELTNYFIEWRKNRLDKLAPQVIVEFRENPSRHQALHQLAITSNPYPIQEYASWLVGHILDEFYQQPKNNQITKVIDAYLTTINPSVKRNLLKVIVHVPSDYRSGELIDHAFQSLVSAQEPIAVRSYSFAYVMGWLKEYPELGEELTVLVEQFPELFKTPAMQSCLKKFAKWKKSHRI